MRKIGIGVIGTGFWGENQVRVFRQNSTSCNLVAICDSDTSRASQISAKYSVPYFTDIDKFLHVDGLEAVTVCTPTQTHYNVTTQVLESDKHVLVEKPMTGNQELAMKLVRMADKKNLKLLVGFIERFNPGVRAVKEMLKQKIVGDLIVATGRRVTRWPVRIGDVGVIKDTAIHDIDAMRYLLEEEVRVVYAQTGSLRHSFEDYAEIMLQFHGGTTGFIDANWLTPRKVRTLIITGSEATINLDYLTQEMTIENSERLVKPYTQPEEPLKLELDNFITTVREDKTPMPSGDDALKAIRICDAALESGKNRHLVNLT
jgi:UDP-N-acetylglucosamine 3-dehydrogenase